MYQIHASDSLVIRVIGTGENGLCIVEKTCNAGSEERFRGTYAECVKWCEDRGVKILG